MHSHQPSGRPGSNFAHWNTILVMGFSQQQSGCQSTNQSTPTRKENYVAASQRDCKILLEIAPKVFASGRQSQQQQQQQ
jgi:hypothetical protein